MDMVSSRPRRVVLDTDPGIDDALAILLALASPEIELTGLSVVHGNCPLSDAVANALAVLHLAGQTHLPVAAGCERPLLREPVTARKTHGGRGLGYASLPVSPVAPVAEHGVDMIIREILADPGEVTLVAVGPLTNVALALRKAPQIAKAVHACIIMGGALHDQGNTTPLAEFNIYADPHAAQIVLSSGMPITIMPWDITRQVRVTEEQVQALRVYGGPVPQFIADATRFYMEFHREHFGWAGCAINDPAALALVWWPELAELAELYVTVETASELTMGKTVGDFGGVTGQPANVRYVARFDSATFVERFLARMAALSQLIR